MELFGVDLGLGVHLAGRVAEAVVRDVVRVEADGLQEGVVVVGQFEESAFVFLLGVESFDALSFF